MELKNSSDNNAGSKLTGIGKFFSKWKNTRVIEQEKFLREINSPDYQKKLDALKGKIVKNEKLSDS